MIYLVQTFDSMILYLPGLKIIFLELPDKMSDVKMLFFKTYDMALEMVLLYSIQFLLVTCKYTIFDD